MINNNFSNRNLRQYKGVLWGNFLLSECMKLLAYSQSSAKPYFWRTTRSRKLMIMLQMSIKILRLNSDVRIQKNKITKIFSGCI